jgi:UDP-N-acetylglucosamine 2-epimerase (non-hydrolysing)
MPEEINRILTDHSSDILFCPTENAVKNLKNEGIIDNVFLTGDVMADSVIYNKDIAEKQSNILDKLNITKGEYLLATIHRASNTDNIEYLKNIVDAFAELDQTLVFPVHPRTKKMLKKYNLYGRLASSIKLINPVGFIDFIKLMNNSKKILTDSGGIQKEAYILKVPCITLRENTEWIETIEDSWNVLVGANKENIVKMVNAFTPSLSTHKERFGDGNASHKIAKILDETISKL